MERGIGRMRGEVVKGEGKREDERGREARESGRERMRGEGGDGEGERKDERGGSQGRGEEEG